MQLLMLRRGGEGVSETECGRDGRMDGGTVGGREGKREVGEEGGEGRTNGGTEGGIEGRTEGGHGGHGLPRPTVPARGHDPDVTVITARTRRRGHGPLWRCRCT